MDDFPLGRAQVAERAVQRVDVDQDDRHSGIGFHTPADVLSHPDPAKVAGHRPQVPDEFYDRG